MKNFKPTLAHAISKKAAYPALVQRKLDGIRCVFTKNGAFSRAGNQFLNVKHLEQQLEGFFEEFPDIILDGELYNHSLKNNFEKIVSLVKTQKPTDEFRQEAAALVEYHIYDVYSPHEPDATQVQRYDVLDTLFECELNLPSVRKVETVNAKDEVEANGWKDKFKAEGYEGAMLRNITGKYEMKRSHNLMKLKDFMDSEAEVIGYVEGKGRLVGHLGKFLMRFPNGIEFGAPATAHKHPQRKQLWLDRDKYIGTTWTVTYFELTNKQVPRFPILKAQRSYE